VDPAVGIVLHKKVAEPVKAGEPLCTIHYNSQSRLERARPLIDQSFQIGEAPPAHRGALVRRIVAA
jgi:thymidine phosphorylase